MNNNIDGIFHSNHNGNGIEKKEQPKKLIGWVIEDDEGTRELINSSIEDVAGLNLSFFNCSDDALREIKRGADLDFLIVDGNLDGSSFDGVSFIEEAKKLFSKEKTPVIFTFTNDPNKEKLMLEKGADFSLNKYPDGIMETCNFLSDVEKIREKLKQIKSKINDATI